jgi:hypothetical protein
MQQAYHEDPLIECHCSSVAIGQGIHVRASAPYKLQHYRSEVLEPFLYEPQNFYSTCHVTVMRKTDHVVVVRCCFLPLLSTSYLNWITIHHVSRCCC